MVWFWLALTIALIVIEVSTVQLVSIWLAAAAGVTAIITAVFPGIDLVWQITVFVVLSVVLLVLTRKFVKKFLQRNKTMNTNLELIKDHTALVVENINNEMETGSVKVNGLVWTARSVDNSNIDKGKLVIVKQISGNKLLVEEKGEN